MNAACTTAPDDGYPASKTCPVIYYGGYKTWIYSFNDNRTSFALVTYDSAGNVLWNVRRDGARYVFDAISDDKGEKITIFGQDKQFIAVNWSDLPHWRIFRAKWFRFACRKTRQNRRLELTA